ncbi:MAG TPA: S1C family serine protease [Candidatus Saccharibacteria bacterium]|nr:S1C family serine protease [Candidatus Saccharibacteria bacterium]
MNQTEANINLVAKKTSRQQPHPAKTVLYVFIWLVIWPIIAIAIVAYVSWQFSVLSAGYQGGDLVTIMLKQIAAWVLWVLITLSVLFIIVIKFMKRFKKHFLKIGRRMLIILTSIGAGFSFAILIIVSFGVTQQASQECVMGDTLQTAIHATLPLASDEGYGTAFAIDDSGTLVTAYHVIEGANKVYINLASGEVIATVIKEAPNYDLALIKVDMKTPDYLKIVSSYNISDPVYALGWPGNTFFSGGASITGGIISRTVETSDVKSVVASAPNDITFVQTDAGINPGNSGGPLINECGAVGVVSAISTSSLYEGLPREEGVSYAVSGQSIKSALGL